MNDRVTRAEPPNKEELAAAEDADRDQESNTISPLPGEPGIPDLATPSGNGVSRKGLLAVSLLVLSLGAVSAVSIQRFVSGGKVQDTDAKLLRDKPTAATAEPRKLDVSAIPSRGTPPGSVPRIPALQTETDETEPIGVRRTAQTEPSPAVKQQLSPEDAPAVLLSILPTTQAGPLRPTQQSTLPVQTPAETAVDPTDPMAVTTRHLQDYQHQLQGLLDTLTRSVEGSVGPTGGQAPASALLNPSPAAAAAAPLPGNGLFGGQLQGSATPRATAGLLGNRSMTLPKGTAFTCSLKTKVISATSGMVGCQVQRNLFSDDGRVLLVERGSHIDGEYRASSVRPGTVRIPVLWTRLRTPLGVTVDLDSPGTGSLGESGIDGHVDNRWMARIGAAMLLSLIDDSVKLVIQQQSNDTGPGTIVLPSTTANTSKLAEKVLDSTINIPPLIYQNQGGVVGVYVARDIDFSSVYELRPVAR